MLAQPVPAQAAAALLRKILENLNLNISIIIPVLNEADSEIAQRSISRRLARQQR